MLTFNYDRLFEIAFLDYFRDSQGLPEIAQFPLNGSSVLNSGFKCGRNKRIEIGLDCFCFLKLHGSLGWWARTCPTNPQTKECRDYYENSPHALPDLLQLERFLAGNKGCHKWEPLIAFPHEKQRFTSDHPGDFVQGPYIGKVWAHAADVLRKATEVTVIGYSFAEIDRTHVVENLLCKTSKTTKITIENKAPEPVRDALKLESNPDLQNRLKQGHLKFIQRSFDKKSSKI